MLRLLSLILSLPVWLIAPPAYANDYLTVSQAQKVLFPEADRYAEASVLLTDVQREAIEDKAGVSQRWKKQEVWRAEKGGKLIGWLIVDNVIGKHEFITYAAALLPEGKVKGVEILSYRETRGDQVREAAWRKVFENKTLADPFKLDNDVPNISGATLSCKNIMNGLKRLLVLQKLVLPSE